MEAGNTGDTELESGAKMDTGMDNSVIEAMHSCTILARDLCLAVLESQVCFIP